MNECICEIAKEKRILGREKVIKTKEVIKFI